MDALTIQTATRRRRHEADAGKTLRRKRETAVERRRRMRETAVERRRGKQLVRRLFDRGPGIGNGGERLPQLC